MGQKTQYVLTYLGEELQAYALVLEAYAGFNPFRLAHASIKFGPLAVSEEARLFCLQHALNHYRKRRFVTLSYQLPGEVSSKSEAFEARITMLGNTLQQNHNRFNLCTLHIPLSSSIDNIRKSYRYPLKRSLKNAQNSGITVRVPLASEVQHAAALFKEMVAYRGLSKSLIDEFLLALRFVERHGFGFLLCSFNEKGEMLAGGLFLIQGNTLVYQYGFSLPREKKLPLQHMVFDEAIAVAIDKGLTQFDLGGYSLYATSADQVSEINRYKWNFSQKLVLSPKLTRVVFRPLPWLLLRKLLGE